MISVNKKLQNFISSLMIIVILAPSVAVFSIPRKTKAVVPTADVAQVPLQTMNVGISSVNAASNLTHTGLKLKDVAVEILKITLRIAAKKALSQLTQSTVNWINTGNWGNPLFIENPGKFFNNITKSEIKNLIALTGYDELRYPFAKNYLIGVIRGYKRTQQSNAQYTLSRVIDDPEYLRGYREDFNVGGWAGFLINSQYSQNNPIGYLLRTNDELTGEIGKAKQDVKELVAQGQGFLSPKNCPSNPNYPPFQDPLKIPGFEFKEKYNPPPVGDAGHTSPEYLAKLKIYNSEFAARKRVAQENYTTKYSCKDGWEDTTPGILSANLVMDALGATQKTKEAAASYGLTDSLAAVFDAMFNKLLEKGLNELTRVTNPKPPAPDNFSYYGETLGSPTDDVLRGPDNPIVLYDFQKILSGKTVILENGVIIAEKIGNKSGQTVVEYVKDVAGNNTTEIDTTYVFNTTGGVTITKQGITINGTYEYAPGAKENTKTELALIDNQDPTSPGIFQVLNGTKTTDGLWQTAKALDICLPGPNKGWEQRLAKEEERNTTSLVTVVDNTVDPADQVRLLKFAIGSFKDWVVTAMLSSPPLVDNINLFKHPTGADIPLNTKIAPSITISSEEIPSLPSAMLFLDAIESIDETSQQLTQFTNQRRAKTLAIARMETIEAALIPFTTQPLPGTAAEKNLISIWKQYEAFRSSISSSASIEEARNELGLAKEKKMELLALNNQCQIERTNAGWRYANTPPWIGPMKIERGGHKIIYVEYEPAERNISVFVRRDGTLLKERNLFCYYPSVGGYSHGPVDGFVEGDTGDTNATGEYMFVGKTRNIDGTSGVYDIPMLEALNVLRYVKKIKRILWSEKEDRVVHIDIDCNNIYFANDLNYIHAGDLTF